MQNLLNPIIYPITPIMPIYAYNSICFMWVKENSTY